jgi:hypothetical protein
VIGKAATILSNIDVGMGSVPEPNRYHIRDATKRALTGCRARKSTRLTAVNGAVAPRMVLLPASKSRVSKYADVHR